MEPQLGRTRLVAVSSCIPRDDVAAVLVPGRLAADNRGTFELGCGDDVTIGEAVPARRLRVLAAASVCLLSRPREERAEV